MPITAHPSWRPDHLARMRAAKRPPRPASEMFWEKVDKSVGSDGCWPWTAYRDRNGYGMFNAVAGESPVYAHRFALELAIGPIPAGRFACHHCDNPPCCNQAHLFVGTNADNMRDFAEKGLHPARKKTHCRRGHEYTPENTRVVGGGLRRCRRCRQIARQREHAQRRAVRAARRGA